MEITFFISERHNPNYLAEIVEISNVRKHPKFDVGISETVLPTKHLFNIV